MNFSLLRLAEALEQSLYRYYGVVRASIQSKISSSQVQDEATSNLLQRQAADSTDSPKSPKLGYAASTFFGRRFIATAVVALLLTILLFWSSRSVTSPAIASYPTTSDSQYLYILMPALYPSVETCKTVLTAEVLNYPVPELIDLGVTAEGGGYEHRPVQDRIPIVLDYLQKLPDYTNDSLVILLDTTSAWFQLRPEVLIQRYYEINRRAEEQLAKEMSAEAVEEGRVSQKVVFSAQKDCTTHADNHPACFAMPVPHSLPRGMRKRDAPRYLNPGSIVGSVKDIRAIFERAATKVGNDTMEAATTQVILSELFADQEIQREVVRRQRWSKNKKIWHAWFGGVDILSSDLSDASIDRLQDQPPELGMGLDYGGEISALTSHGAASDLIFTKHGPRSLAQDIARSMPPFWTVSGSEPNIPHGLQWSDTSLLTHKTTKIAPALVINDPNTPPSPSDTHTLVPHKMWWPNLWLQPFARVLYGASVFLPSTVAASVQDHRGAQHIFWHPVTANEHAGVRAVEGKWLAWNDTCHGQEDSEEVFRDGLGEWKDPMF